MKHHIHSDKDDIPSNQNLIPHLKSIAKTIDRESKDILSPLYNLLLIEIQGRNFPLAIDE